MIRKLDQHFRQMLTTQLVCAVIAFGTSVTASAHEPELIAPTDAPDLPSPPVLSELGARGERSAGWFAMPTVHVQLSTPGAYLRGWRDDFTTPGNSAYHSEYTFTIFSDAEMGLRLQGDATTDTAAKPFLEDQGMQIYVAHELPLHRLATDVFGSKADLGRAEVTCGLRYQNTSSDFWLLAFGSFLGRFETATQANNHFLGPQVALNWSKQKRGFTFEASSKVMIGQNVLHANQWGSMGFDLVTGGLNSSVSRTTTSFANSIEDDIDTAVADVRASVTYAIFENLNLRLGYSGIYFADMRWAWNIQSYTLPALGFDPGRSSELWTDQIYASVEWRH